MPQREFPTDVHEALGFLLTASESRFVEALVQLSPAARLKIAQQLSRITNEFPDLSNTELLTRYPQQVKDFKRMHDIKKDEVADHYYDRATLIKMCARTPERAAAVWPVPANPVYLDTVPALFAEDMEIFVNKWAADYCKAPRNYDRNRSRERIFDWIESSRVPLTDSPFLPPYFLARLQMACDPYPRSADPIQWLAAHPRLLRGVLPRVFTTPGVNGGSLEQFDQTLAEQNYTMSGYIIPWQLKNGHLTEAALVNAVRWGLETESINSYQKRWYKRQATSMGIAS